MKRWRWRFRCCAGAARGVAGDLARRLSAARFRTLLLAGLDGGDGCDDRDGVVATGEGADSYLARLEAPFTANDVLAALARLPDAPPFAPVWDPVLIAARKAFEAVEADVRRDVHEGNG